MNQIICDYCRKKAKYTFEWKFSDANTDESEFGESGLYDICEDCKRQKLLDIKRGYA